MSLVVNAAHGGYGRGRSRVLHLIRQAGGDHDWDATRGRPALAELGGMYAFSPNVRLASAPYEIDYPFTVSGRPVEQQIPMNDLEVMHDPRTDSVRLVARSLRSEVTALHLGMMADALLPPAARTMTLAFGTGYYVHPSMPLLTPADALSAPKSVLTSPRVMLGRIVVQRARWVASTVLVPVRGKGESDAGYLTKIVTWLRAHGIPMHSFVRMFALDPRDGLAEPTSMRILGKSRKPVYVDFANWYLVMAFERMLKGAGPTVIFEEVLPAPADALGPAEADPSVTEFVVEISEPEAVGG